MTREISGRNHLLLCVLFAALSPALVVSVREAAAENNSTAVTVYSTADAASFDPQQFLGQARLSPQSVYQVPGFGVVKETRELELKSGINELRFADVAQFIDPTTVNISSESDKDLSVLEQSFQFDLASADKILSRYIDREIKVVVPSGQQTETVAGRLISGTTQSVVLQTTEGVRLLNSPLPQLQLGDLPGGLITKPTLVWKLSAKKAGAQRIKTSYQTGGLSWRADYNLVVDPADTKGDLTAWVTLINLSGASYADAQLKLIAGSVQRITPPQRYMTMAKTERRVDEASAPAGFEEKAFGEYHLYALPRRTDILQNSTQQITLFPAASDIPVERLLVYYGNPETAYWLHSDSPAVDRSLGNSSNKKLDVYMRFKNDKQSRLGMPLPKGKVRVYKEDPADGSLEFLGEDVIDHTPKDEVVLVKIGQAFDIVGERTQTDYSSNLNGHTISESFKIELRNHKDREERVLIKESLFRWTNWDISSKSDAFQKVDSRTIHFDVKVPANGAKTVTYTVRYTW